ncbi:glycoside hydrolase family 38 C-terminal domain-containing protein [Williamsia sp. CHRR-6]|uniref:alpha-mannosidase n=1 Tax=Williamsia sp. CHRR-6 TaxID=2835871 RepID=UPI001BD9C2BA|nr:glycoside hydrolase family 38 C-terminal domain-containing protein [Williamsia sp. CHRR-6]MBT0566399.1 alpha-mannosidase [Williamsia sp. CHRR-6]
MHDDRISTEGRLTRFVRDHLDPNLYRHRLPLAVSAWEVDGEPVAVTDAVHQQFSPFCIGDRWGAPWTTTWFRFTATIPAHWDLGVGPLEAVIDLGFDTVNPGFQSEGLAFDLDGRPIKGVSPMNRYVPLAGNPGDPVAFLLEAAGNPDIAKEFDFLPTSLGDPATAGHEPRYRLATADLAVLDTTVWELRQDIAVLDGLMRQLPTDRPRRAVIMRALEQMLDTLDPDDIAGTAAAARDVVAPALHAPADASAHRLYAVGHAHIDSAWLWPVRETIRKCARTFSNVLALMDDDPDFVFACSSAQQLTWIKERYPALFERIRAKVADGQFVPVGGMWVESDTNMVGGEAMARQLLVGKTFFLDEFGVECEEVWLPDSFGYSASLPGIFRAAGARWFLTQKISWNTTNRMPHHTFWWEGIDGSRIFTHFPPVDKYNSDLGAADLAHAQRNYAEHGHGSMSLVPYGWGDGGGGPTREMTAVAARTRSLEGSPSVRTASPHTFFLDAQAEYPDPPVWLGEMYLESHRGTYTSQSRTKQGNRRSEHLLREAELWCTTAMVVLGAPYPHERLDRIWKLVLLQQFHDILPGSSIAWVHREAERNYAAITAELDELITTTLAQLVGSGEVALQANAAAHPRDGVAAGAIGIAAPHPEGTTTVTEHGDDLVIDNGALRLVVDRRGLITSWFDIGAAREVIAPGQVGNLLQVHRDTPNEWDAWDIDAHYRRTVTDLTDLDSMEVVHNDIGVTLRLCRSFGASTIEQDVVITTGTTEVGILTTVDWHERQKLLKLGFAFDVACERFASEVGFGHVFRPTHANTSWDAAKFETCAQRWIHLGEPGFGVAIANDSTYGHDVTRCQTTTTARVSLLRAPLYPDPDADQGTHRFGLSITSGAEIVDAVRSGYAINLRQRRISGARVVDPLISVDNPGVVVEAVKAAADGSGDVVVRCYESLGARARAQISAGFGLTQAVRTDLLERPLPEAAVEISPERSMSLTLRPFEIVTLRLRRS